MEKEEIFTYVPKSVNQLRGNYNSIIKKNLNAFLTFNEFLNWYLSKEKTCFYCGLTEIQSQEIVIRGLLTSKRFPQNGKAGQGKARGMWLEIDRFYPHDHYSVDNCVLACYFCNNDKSDVFNGHDYKLFYQNRFEFLKQLLERNNT